MKRQWILVGYALLALLLFVALFSVSTGTFGTKLEADISRFQPGSVDIDVAMKTLVRDPPRMLAPPEPKKVTLLYPPSTSDLEKLSGPQ